MKWEDPPPETRGQYDWSKIADELRANPMQWALIYENGRASVATAVKQGSCTAVHPGLGFEVMTRNNTRHPPRRCDLYMRFNPDKVDELRLSLMQARENNQKESV